MLEKAMIPLEKATGAESASSTAGAALNQHVVVEGRILVTRSAFVGHSFLPEDQKIVAFVKDLLKEMQFNCSTGEKAEAGTIHDKVRRRILGGFLRWHIHTTKQDRRQGTLEHNGVGG